MSGAADYYGPGRDFVLLRKSLEPLAVPHDIRELTIGEELDALASRQ